MNQLLEAIQRKDEYILKMDNCINDHKIKAKQQNEEWKYMQQDYKDKIEHLNEYINSSSETQFREKHELITSYTNQIECLTKSQSLEVGDLVMKIESMSAFIRNNNMNPNMIIEKCKQCITKDSEISELKCKVQEWQEYLKNMSITN